jgi:hypothetical protein
MGLMILIEIGRAINIRLFVEIVVFDRKNTRRSKFLDVFQF